MAKLYRSVDRFDRTLFLVVAATVVVVAAIIAAAIIWPERYDPGPAGRVIDKEQTGVKIHDYFLTVRTPDGRTVKFQVTDEHHDRCYRGSAYPRCTTIDR